MVAELGSLLDACDVLLITATDRETTALKAALGAVTSAEPGILHGRRKTYTDHGQIAGTRILRVRCEMGAGTPGGAGSTVADAIHEVAPRAIIMVGIAFGAKGKAKQRLGTILVSQQLQDYELQRVGTDPQGSLTIIPRGDRVSASPRLVDRLRHAKESWSAKEPVEFGLVLSGDKLVDSVDFLATLKEHFPEAIGGEMEGRGLYVEAKDRAEWILVKAVCDWADGDKRKNKARNQKKAAEAAARFVVHAILQGGLGSGPRTWGAVSAPSTTSPAGEVRGTQSPLSPPPSPPRPPLVMLFNIGARGAYWMTPERLAAAQGLDLRGAIYIRLNHEIDRSAITPEEWQEIAQGLDGLVSQAEAVTPDQASRCIVAGQAPLPVFAYLGQRMKALSVPITVVNFRGGEGTLDVIDRPTARQARGRAPITATEPTPVELEGAGAPVLSILCSREYNFTDTMAAELVRSDGGRFVGAYRIALQASHPSDLLRPVDLDALIWSVDEALAWLARNEAPSDGLTVVIGGPAWVAFWVGNRLNPKNFGHRLSFPIFSGGRYVRALSIPMQASPTATGSEAPTRVFISYSHDTLAHVEAVTALANQLCAAGIDAWIDRYVVSPPEGWPRWMRGQILKADVVLVVCTETYRERFEGGAGGEGHALDADAPGKGVAREGLIATAMLYAGRGHNRQFVPVLIGGASVEHIPVELQGASIFRLPEDYAGLLQRIRGRPPVDRPAVGGGHADSGERPVSKGVDRPVRSGGVPSSMNERGAPPVEPNPPKEAMRDLVDFLTHRFSEQSLQEMGFLYGGSKVSGELPGSGAPLRSLAFTLAMVLWRHGLINAEFFRYLEEQRPKLREDVRRIRAAFGLGPAVTDEQRSAVGERPQVAEVPGESTLPRGAARSEPARSEPARGEGGQREPDQSERRATAEPKGSKGPGSPGESQSSSGAGSAHPQHSRAPWTEGELEDQLVELLERAPKLVLRLRDLLVAVAGEDSELAAPDLIARRIIALGSGVASARKLVDACFKAVFKGKSSTRGEADVACDVICLWLPFGYPEVDHVVVLRLDNSPETGRNLHVRTKRPMIVDVHMARIDGRQCEFTVSTVSDPRGGVHVPQSMLPLPPASSERISAEEVAQLVVDTVCKRFHIGGEQRALDARIRIETECIKDRSPYIVVKPKVRERSFSDDAIRALNAQFPELHVVILSAVDASQERDESRIWMRLTDLLKAREN